MTGSRRFLLIAVGVCAGAGCLFPSLDDLSGDASTTSDASDVVTTSDVTDAGTPADSSDAAKGRFCDGVDATFCEDFDEPDGNYIANWSSLDLGAGNTVTLESDATTSAPNALSALIPTNNNGGASLWKDLPPTATHYDYSFAVRLVDPYDAGSGLALFNQIEVDSTDASAAYTEYRLAQEASGTHFHTHVYFADGGNVVSDLPLAVSFVPGQWYHCDIQLDVGPPAKVTIYVENATALQATIAEATNGPGTSAFLAGLSHTYTPTGTVHIEVDDVVMRVK